MVVVKLIVLSQALFCALASADATNLNPKGEGCVDPSGYLQCYEDNVNTLNKCMTDAKNSCDSYEYSTCVLACGNAQLAANIGCWLTSCWNEVYSCAYQETAIQYLSGADQNQGSQIPYYPAPDNAPGGCVCNLGNIWGNFTETYALNAPCESYASDGSETETADCQCCWDSSFLSEFIEWCPHNDLSDIAISTMVDTFQLGYNNTASNKCSILSDPDQCINSFSLDTAASTWYNPGQLPSGFPGTAPLSDTTDAGSLTSAPDPYTFSIFPSYITAITPAPYNKKNADATSSETTGAAATAKSTPSATGSTDTSSGDGDNEGNSNGSNKITLLFGADFGVYGLTMYTIACALLGAALIA